MTATDCAFAGAAFLDSDAGRLLTLSGGPEHLKEILRRSGQDLEREYVRLFLSPAGAPCSPWQSAHEDERKLMGDAHMSASRWYSAYGASPKSDADPADHIGLLLTFHAQMLVSGVDPADVAEFAARHLSWIPAFAETVVANAQHEFYRELGSWVLSVLPKRDEAPE